MEIRTYNNNTAIPEKLGFNWGAFFVTPIWLLFHGKIGISLLLILLNIVFRFIGVPGISSFIVVLLIDFSIALYFGFRGNRIAWDNKGYISIEQLKEKQRIWNILGFIGFTIYISLLLVFIGHTFKPDIEAYGWISIFPPVLAIILAIKTKQVYPSLFLGIWLGWTAINRWNPLAGLGDTLEAAVNIFNDSGNTKVIIFSMMVGALIILMQHSGGVPGFIQWISSKGLVKNRRSSGFLLWIIGVLIFIESNMINLVIGSIGRPIFDKFKVPREKLAYIAHSTSAPVCIMIPFNGWGAILTGLLVAQQIENPFFMVLRAVTTNFYAIFTILLVLIIITTQKDFGPMATAEKRARETGKLVRDEAQLLVSEETIAMPVKEGVQPKPINMILPLIAMVLMVPIGLLVTGKGRIEQGSGSTAVFWAVLMGIFAAAALYKIQNIFTMKEILDLVMKGMGGLIPMGLLMVFAFTMGATCKMMGTGPYVAELATATIHPALVIPLVFLVACFISFATGTSWGTFAIMMPIAVPLAQNMELNLPLMVSAVMGGGVFGDHCSPVSDTTIISSMATACDPMDHVNTQLPYALTAAGLALVLFFIFSYF